MSVTGEHNLSHDLLTFVYFVRRPCKISKLPESPLPASALGLCKIHERPSDCTSLISRPRRPCNVAGGLETRKPVASSGPGSRDTRSSHRHSQKRCRKRVGQGHQAPLAPSTVRRPASTPRRCSCRWRSMETRRSIQSVFKRLVHGAHRNHFGGSQQDLDNMHAYHRVRVRASPPPLMSAAGLQYCSSSGSSRFQSGRYLM
jgi:hypothetical protein